MASREDPESAGNVLAVDDCPTMREVMRASLEGLGYRVRAVDSGWAALDAAAAAPFDVIVLDVEMPGLDGMAVGRALRSMPHTAGAAIAMHSSMAEAEVRTGFDDYDAYVPKSAGVNVLGEHVGRLRRQQQMPAPRGPMPAPGAQSMAAD